jgi:glycosyltransferase involved in cell wall biosynthesis
VSSVSPTAPGTVRVDGIFVMGMYGSGVDVVGDVVRALGLPGVDTARPGPLADFNDRLLASAGGDRSQLPAVGPREAARLLAPFRDEARQVFATAFGSPNAGDGGAPLPWVWADPPLSLLAMFWKDALAISPVAILVHRHPSGLASRLRSGPGPVGADAAVTEWDRYNRAAMAQCFEWPAAVVRQEWLLEQPKAQVDLVVEFLATCGVTPVDGGIEAAIERLETAADADVSDVDVPTETLTNDHRTLDRILAQMDGLHPDPDGWKNDHGVLDEVATFYDEDYYGASYDANGIPYSRDEEHWLTFFRTTASAIVSTLHPRSVLDVGCATGMLVEALRAQGVDARGIDVSRWAIDHVPAALAPYCTQGTVSQEIEGTYDLITCIEVAEHLPAFSVADAVANLCRHTDAVLFSSTPDDFDEPTHLNVESSGYWSEMFLRQGFLRDVDYDASFLAAHAILFRRTATDVGTVVYEYERAISHLTPEVVRGRAAIAEHDSLADRFNTLSDDNRALQAEYSRVADQVTRYGEMESRRKAELLAAHDKIAEHNAAGHRLFLQLQERDAELDAIRRTKTFRYTAALRRLYGKLRPPVALPTPAETPVVEQRTYATWVERYDTLDDADRAAIRRRLGALSEQPLVSIIFPVYNTPASYLRAAIESVLAQIYTNWELCIADDCSTEPHVAEIIAEYVARDPRITSTTRAENGHISAASNTALDMATGSWIIPFDHDDLLAEHALALGMLALHDHPDAGLLYSDEDKIDDRGRRHLPYFKPDFDPLLLLGQNYLTHLLFLRRDLVVAAGGYRLGYEGSQDWDLILRVTERLEPSHIVHIPHVLYHWRVHDASTSSLVSAKPYAQDAGQQAVVDALARRGLAGQVSRIASLGHNRVTWHLPAEPPLVSIIIPTKDGALLRRCIDSLLSLTSYPNFEIVVIDNGSEQFATLEFLRENEQHLTVIRDERPFNYSALNNAAVRRTSGDVVCLLNDDTEVITADWLDEMVGQLLVPGVGAVGAKLYYPDGRIQHGGVIVGLGGVAGHSHRMSDRLAPGYYGRLLVAQSLSAVTGACMVVRRQAWEEVGGLEEENLAIAFNDVDFGLRLRRAGWRVVWTPHATLYHHESISRGPDDVGHRVAAFAKEIQFVKDRWGESLLNDPAYNPNLTLDTEDFALSWPPRVSYR